MPITLDVGGIGVSVGVSVQPTLPVQQTTPAQQQQQINPSLVTAQMLVPIRNINGAVVQWQLQTIEYDSRLTNPPGRQKSYAALAPWMVGYRVVSIP